MRDNKGIAKAVAGFIWTVFCCLLVILNYQPVGHKQLLLQFLGVAGILFALYLYNREYNKE